MLVKLYEHNPSERELDRIVAALDSEGLIACPTDSLYVLGCSLRSPRAIERLRRLTGKETDAFSVIFSDIGQAAGYCRVDNAAFRILKRNLPGAFTFLLPASSRMPERALGRRRTIGVRIPANAVVRAIVDRMGVPLVAASVRWSGDETEYATDPSLIEERYGDRLALVVDGGTGGLVPTTVVDLTGGEPEIVREGGGELQ